MDTTAKGVLVIATVVAGSEGRTILVGDSEGWRAGTNYTQWTIQNNPFYINDTLVFKYPPPGNSTAPLSVYLLPNSSMSLHHIPLPPNHFSHLPSRLN